MSSTPVVGTPTLTVSYLSSNAPSSSPSSISSPSGANSVSLLTLATSPTPSTSPVTASSKQSQPLSSALQSAMSATTVTTTAAPSPASPSTPSSTVSLTSPRTSPMSSSTSSIVISSGTDSRPITSTPQASVRPTTSSTTTTPRTTQSSIQTSSPLSTTTLGRTTSSTPVTTSTFDMPFTTMLSTSSSQDPPAVPLMTVTESTTIFITSTNNEGQVVTSIPPVVTEVITTTGNGGIVTTITQAVVNPTLAPNNSTTGESPFFANTGAVVGVFVVVGLASASILLWILFAIRHRQRIKQLEQDTAVEAVVAGLNRAPLDDDYEDASPTSPSTRRQLSSEMGQRSTLFGLGDSGSLATSAYLLGDAVKDSANSQTDPAVRRMTNYPMGYVPARTTSIEPFTDDLGSSRDRKSSYGHTPTYSAGSFEPLLANYAQNTQDQDNSSAAVQPPRNHSPQHPESGLVFHGYPTDESPANRSRPSSRRQNSSDSFVLQGEEDYTRYVLMVCNIPDDQSQHSL